MVYIVGADIGLDQNLNQNTNLENSIWGLNQNTDTAYFNSDHSKKRKILDESSPGLSPISEEDFNSELNAETRDLKTASKI
jgi:hypothetical protein